MKIKWVGEREEEFVHYVIHDGKNNKKLMSLLFFCSCAHGRVIYKLLKVNADRI